MSEINMDSNDLYKDTKKAMMKLFGEQNKALGESKDSDKLETLDTHYQDQYEDKVTQPQDSHSDHNSDHNKDQPEHGSTHTQNRLSDIHHKPTSTEYRNLSTPSSMVSNKDATPVTARDTTPRTARTSSRTPISSQRQKQHGNKA